MKVAVIISDVVSQGKLLKCVRSLCRQSHNNYEIVLPDLGNFGRKEHRALRQIEKEHAFFRVFCNPKRNRAEIINAAVMSTSCELLLFTESHCIVDQNWIADWVSVFEKGGVSVATGSRIISSSRSWVSRAEKDLNREIRARARKIQNASA
ncbi:glycosyltransferase, partial [Candidatus Woesearchaeota archaeon]|nr:glycosyltransferase [Candidatus Woesearchaeota archaeon]